MLGNLSQVVIAFVSLLLLLFLLSHVFFLSLVLPRSLTVSFKGRKTQMVELWTGKYIVCERVFFLIDCQCDETFYALGATVEK